MRLRPLFTALFALAVALRLAGGAALAQDAPTLQAHDFAAVCGDSITEQKLYSVFIEDYLLMCQPAAGLRVMQAGWGGEVAHGFLPRMERDVLALHPTVVTTCYGMNDGGYGPFDPNRGKLYRDTHNAIVAGLRKAGVRFIILGSPHGGHMSLHSSPVRFARRVWLVFRIALARLPRKSAEAQSHVIQRIYFQCAVFNILIAQRVKGLKRGNPIFAVHFLFCLGK